MKTAAVNLSCGYYKAHTKEEYVIWEEMVNATQEAIKLIERADGTKFEYIENEYGWDDRWGYGDYAYYNVIGDSDLYATKLFGIDYELKGMMCFAEVYANSQAEAVGKFLMENNKLTYNNIFWV